MCWREVIGSFRLADPTQRRGVAFRLYHAAVAAEASSGYRRLKIVTYRIRMTRRPLWQPVKLKRQMH